MRLINLLSAVTAVSAAIVTMVTLLSKNEDMEVLTALILQTVLVTVALALLIGLWNLLNVHMSKLGRRERGWPYSLLTIAAALAVLLIRAADVKVDGESLSDALFEAVQVSLESALAGLLFFFLVYAAYRMLRERVTFNGCLFLVALLIVLLGAIPLGGLDAFVGLRDWLLEFPVTAGARGILIGVALGTITVGLRVLIGQERAYRE
jgi:hypothetical protein